MRYNYVMVVPFGHREPVGKHVDGYHRAPADGPVRLRQDGHRQQPARDRGHRTAPFTHTGSVT